MMVNVPASGLLNHDPKLGLRWIGVGSSPMGVYFIPRSAPGDIARVKVTTLKRRWARGQLEEIPLSY
ncbi:MAG: hypothetical protein Ct9H300mP15_19550 [Gemmatimonadota bacterium]|nr:MAG: hypothetical protein Ct9H300mP15_19550 [Gemmatimonadota bacterium]